MANQVIAFRAPKRLVSAIELAASMNGVERNEEILLKLTLAYESYIRMLEAETKTPLLIRTTAQQVAEVA